MNTLNAQRHIFVEHIILNCISDHGWYPQFELEKNCFFLTVSFHLTKYQLQNICLLWICSFLSNINQLSIPSQIAFWTRDDIHNLSWKKTAFFNCFISPNKILGTINLRKCVHSEYSQCSYVVDQLSIPSWTSYWTRDGIDYFSGKNPFFPNFFSTVLVDPQPFLK